MTWDDERARAALRDLFDTAIAAADPRHVLAAHLPAKPTGGRLVFQVTRLARCCRISRAPLD